MVEGWLNALPSFYAWFTLQFLDGAAISARSGLPFANAHAPVACTHARTYSRSFTPRGQWTCAQLGLGACSRHLKWNRLASVHAFYRHSVCCNGSVWCSAFNTFPSVFCVIFSALDVLRLSCIRYWQFANFNRIYSQNRVLIESMDGNVVVILET